MYTPCTAREAARLANSCLVKFTRSIYAADLGIAIRLGGRRSLMPLAEQPGAPFQRKPPP